MHENTPCTLNVIKDARPVNQHLVVPDNVRYAPAYQAMMMKIDSFRLRLSSSIMLPDWNLSLANQCLVEIRYKLEHFLKFTLFLVS